MAWIGLDIGGANLKAAFPGSSDCPAMEMPFPMWTDWKTLEEALGKLLRDTDLADAIAVTMTGELADNFENRRAGVLFIADAIESVAANRRVVYYCCDGVWRIRKQLEQDWGLVAAANWHATATWGARLLPDRSGLVIDVGSTTTDVSVVKDDVVATTSQNDLERLTTGELLYVGADRTPICGLLDHVDYGGNQIALANELFATVGDAAVWKGVTPEFPELMQTADRRPKTRAAGGQRMARMLCRDLVDLDSDLIDALAEQTIAAAQAAIGDTVSKCLATSGASAKHALVVGEGQFLVGDAMKEIDAIYLADQIGEAASACGPAHAVAVLASENF